MEGSVNPVVRRNDEYSARRLSTDSKPQEPFLGNIDNLQLFKPEVSKLTCEEANIGVRCAMLDLPHPPRLSKSSQFCVDDL
ncbi:hypothetical protein Gotur_016840 [Gossypium turneri]